MQKTNMRTCREWKGMNILSESEGKSCTGIVNSVDDIALCDRTEERLKNGEQGLSKTSRVVLLGVITGSIHEGIAVAVPMMFGLYAL